MSLTQENPRKIYKDYSRRIEVLCSHAEDDGFVLNEASERDFWQYIASLHHLQENPQMDADRRRAVETRRSTYRIVQIV